MERGAERCVASRAFVSADLGYGERLFAGLGPERLEPRASAQIALGLRSPHWELAGNVRLEHSLAPALITSVGVSRRLARLRVGLEAVGEDLEGLFDHAT